MKDPRIQDLLNRMAALQADQVVVERGDVLFRQGDPGDSLFLVKTGRLRVIHNLGLPNEQFLGEVGPGEPVGELALLWSTTRSATVVAVRFTALARISKAAFEQLTEQFPAEAMELMRVVAWRLKQSYECPVKRSLPSNVAVVPASPDVPLAAYCVRLMESLPTQKGNSALLTSADVPAGIASAAARAGVAAMKNRNHQLARWLSEHADQSEMNILQTDADLTPWTQRCLHQADLVIILARADADVTPGPIEQALAQLSRQDALPRVDLVLLHEAPPPYRGTGAWLEKRRITRHYHVRLHSTEDRMRAGRLLTGTDLSLVLGGGGARGLGHIGVFRACQEVGLTIDRVIGVSLGSVIAGLIAQGRDWSEVAGAMRHCTVERGPLTQFTIPAISIDSGRRYFAQLDYLFGDTQIEDLPINYFCVSCSLSRARVLVHRTGGLAKWIGASSSVPGIAPPLVEAGELIVDGGVLNNLPIDLIRADGAGRVLAVDVSPEIDLLMPANYFGRPSAYEVLWQWLRSRLGIAGKETIQYPSIISLLFRASILSTIPATEALRKHADLLIELPLADFKFFDWPKIAEIIEVGWREAMEKLPLFTGRPKDAAALAPVEDKAGIGGQYSAAAAPRLPASGPDEPDPL